MNQKLWRYYLSKEIAKVFFLILFSLYFLYLLIDYSTHLQAEVKGTAISPVAILLYYAQLFSKRISLLLPLALIVATAKVLCTLNRHNELLAFQTAGFSLFSLARPFFFFAFCCTAANLYNFEYFLPSCFSSMSQFEQEQLKHQRSHSAAAVHALLLPDGTRLIYQYYDPTHSTLLDVFLIRSIDEVWHMKALALSGNNPIGICVDLMMRNCGGLIEKKASFATYPFIGLKIALDLQQPSKELLQGQSISALFTQAFQTPNISNQKKAAAQTHLYFKLVMSCLPFLMLIGMIPYCIPSKRHLPIFFIFSISIFSYIFLFTLLDACIILGETQLVPAHWAILGVPALLLFIFGQRFIKTCIGFQWISRPQLKRGI
ncbi:MAG: LptF/LptG family permease [Chlamydiota bacterium]